MATLQEEMIKPQGGTHGIGIRFLVHGDHNDAGLAEMAVNVLDWLHTGRKSSAKKVNMAPTIGA